MQASHGCRLTPNVPCRTLSLAWGGSRMFSNSRSRVCQVGCLNRPTSIFRGGVMSQSIRFRAIVPLLQQRAPERFDLNKLLPHRQPGHWSVRTHNRPPRESRNRQRRNCETNQPNVCTVQRGLVLNRSRSSCRVNSTTTAFAIIVFLTVPTTAPPSLGLPYISRRQSCFYVERRSDDQRQPPECASSPGSYRGRL
jgi:hypothetical protein